MKPMRRSDCAAYLERIGWEVSKSSCVYCPFKSDDDWARMKAERPDEFAIAVDFERRMRELKPSNYLHDDLVPIDEVVFRDDRQIDLFGNECEGMFGV